MRRWWCSRCARRDDGYRSDDRAGPSVGGAGAGIVRIALDNEKEVPALKEIRAQTPGITLSVDLQENYRIAGKVAPHVDKIRYNPGHLHHIEKAKSIPQKVKWLVDIARDQRYRGADRGQLRVGGADVSGEVPGRSIERDRRVGCDQLRVDGRVRLRSFRGLAARIPTQQGARRQSAIHRATTRRAAASGRDRSGAAARRDYQDAAGIREIAGADRSATRFGYR